MIRLSDLKKSFIILAYSLLLGGCATSKIQDYRSTNEPTNKKLEVPFVAQGDNLCGPATLKMASEKYIPGTPLETYKKFAFAEKAGGTFKSDMLSTTRRLGLVPYRVSNLKTMLSEIDQNRPVIVFQNLGLSWFPKWHYALLTGYDSQKNIVYLHSGFTAYDEMGFSLFVRTWKRGENWSYAILPSDIIPSYAEWEEVLDNATTFDNLKNIDVSRNIYSSMTKRWPNRFEPYLGLANIEYALNKKKSAISYIKKAIEIEPNHPALLYNLAVLYQETGQKKLAFQFKTKTLQVAPPDQKEFYNKKFTF